MEQVARNNHSSGWRDIQIFTDKISEKALHKALLSSGLNKFSPLSKDSIQIRWNQSREQTIVLDGEISRFSQIKFLKKAWHKEHLSAGLNKFLP